MQTSLRHPQQPEPGARVQLCDTCLQAFYGRYGTVVSIHRQTHSGQITLVDVMMDDVPATEGAAHFYLHELLYLEDQTLAGQEGSARDRRDGRD